MHSFRILCLLCAVDYSTFTQDVRLGPSLRRVCIEVTINGDSIPEDTESFTIQLLGEDFIPISKTTITINDDDCKRSLLTAVYLHWDMRCMMQYTYTETCDV